MSKKVKNFIFQTLKIVFSVGIIVWLVQSGKLNFKALLNMLQPEYLFIGLFLIGTNMYLTSERWRMLLLTQSHKLSPFHTYKLTLIGIFFNFVVPGGVGGDIVKAFYFAKDHPESRMVAATSVLMDRVLGLYSMTLMAFVAMIFDWNHVQSVQTLQLLWTFILLLFVGFTIILGVIFSQKIYDRGTFNRLLNKLPLASKTVRVYESLHLYGRNLKYVIASILISLLAQTFSILFMILAGNASGLGHMSWSTYFLVAPLGFMATAIPISPAGVGVGQAAFYFLFNLYSGETSDLGPTAITALQVGTFLFGLLGAYFYMQRKEKIPQSIEQN
ncbi:MAG: flippase-like domain-containing protein [Proteobacteria bacterium]|nr:MAG: flippase-like domain-containing protein [Pseudomonadota bacterium]